MSKIYFTLDKDQFKSKKSGEITEVTRVYVEPEDEVIGVSWIDFKVKIFRRQEFLIDVDDIDFNADHVTIKGYAIPWNYVLGVQQICEYVKEKDAKKLKENNKECK